MHESHPPVSQKPSDDRPSETPAHSITRRSLLRTAPSVAAILVPSGAWSQSDPSSSHTLAHLELPVLRQPDLAFAYLGDAEPARSTLNRSGASWTGGSSPGALRVEFAPAAAATAIVVEAESAPVQRIHLRWKHRISEDTLALGDAWERSYGDLEWRPLQAERVLPWYVLLHAHDRTSGFGVKTGASVFAFWQVDPAGISLWLDLRNGGGGVTLGKRTLAAATIVQCVGSNGESACAVARRLCRTMAEGTALPALRGSAPTDVLYGSNDWYYAYGENTHDGILRDADLVASLAPANGARPFTVIDDGYQDTKRFPSLSRLATEIRTRNVLPGIWIRPLRAAAETTANLLLPADRFADPAHAAPAFDPTIPEALRAIRAVAEQACSWGFDLIKHDFTTFELFGQWGSQMGASPTRGQWHFNDRSRTNAEIVAALYRELRAGCGDARIILGCNTVGHLSVGIFDASRTGDDVSGKEWERTRRTGVNTLAFRTPQHRTFYSIDADCVPFTPDIPWAMTRQWLRAVADSGTTLLISPDPRAIGAEQKAAIREAFAECVARSQSEPLDWTVSRSPSAWRSSHGVQQWNWTLEEGESPFPIGVQRGPE